MNSFGRKLAEIRSAHHFTLQTLAQRLGYKSHGYLSELESGKKEPTVQLVLAISTLFNISTDELLRDTIVSPVVISREKKTIIRSSLIERFPTANEVEQLRLLLSIFQDGTGQLVQAKGTTLPGWRDFERSTALVFGGIAQESKSIFDVVIENSPTGIEVTNTGYAPDRYQYSGISCKMRGTLTDLERSGRATIELSNSAGKFWQALNKIQITQDNYKAQSEYVGRTLVDLVRAWHEVSSSTSNHQINLSQSCYLVLSWSKSGDYQLHLFPLQLPTDVNWTFPAGQSRLVGHDKSGKLYEWYGESGGQLKYYPPVSSALWSSIKFRLEALPDPNTANGLITKATTYFPTLWQLTKTD